MAFTLPSSNTSHIDSKNPAEVFQFCREVIDHFLYTPAVTTLGGNTAHPTFNIARHSALSNLVFNLCHTYDDRFNRMRILYTMVDNHFDQVSAEIANTVLVVGPEGVNWDLIVKYLVAWDRYLSVAVVIGNCLAQLDRSFVQREEREGNGFHNVDASTLRTWGYSTTFTSRIVAETSARAASEAAVISVRALILRHWRRNVINSMDLNAVVHALQVAMEGDDGLNVQVMATAVRTSLLSTGVGPCVPTMGSLNNIAGDAGIGHGGPVQLQFDVDHLAALNLVGFHFQI